MFYTIVQLLAKLVFRFLFRLEVRGSENIPLKGPFILAANHQSNLDPFLLGAATHRKLAYFAKAELFRFRVGKMLLRRLNAFPVQRGRMDRRALETCFRQLEEGMGLVMFPEGTRHHDPEAELAPKPGLGMLAVRSGAVVIPARILGAEKILPPGKTVPRPRKVVIVFGPPVSDDLRDMEKLAGRGKSKVYLRFAERVLQRIYDLP